METLTESSGLSNVAIFFTIEVLLKVDPIKFPVTHGAQDGSTFRATTILLLLRIEMLLCCCFCMT